MTSRASHRAAERTIRTDPGNRLRSVRFLLPVTISLPVDQTKHIEHFPTLERTGLGALALKRVYRLLAEKARQQTGRGAPSVQIATMTATKFFRTLAGHFANSPLWRGPGLVFAVSGLLILALPVTPAHSEKPEPTPPILVELFTSQGCSSCPPADRLLSALAASDDDIITLAFHVDYWNYIGWTDPFSSSDWSDRQRRYAHALEARQIYTPQMVVNGRRHGVGSDQTDVASMIRAAAADETAGRIEIEITKSTNSSLSFRLHPRLEAHAEDEELVAWVALVEDGLETPVGKGENARRTLRNDRVVRRFERAARIVGDTASNTTMVDFDLEPEWHRERLSIAAFLQNPETLHVVASSDHSLQ